MSKPEILFVSFVVILLLMISCLAIKGLNTEEHISHKVTLYSFDGKEIKRWVASGEVLGSGDHYYFTDKYNDKRSVQVSGTIIVEVIGE